MNRLETPAWDEIEAAVRRVPGWSSLGTLFGLHTLAYSSSHLPGDIVELGAWCGRSSVALGLAVKKNGKGKVHCVDLFPKKNDWYRNRDGSYSLKVKIGKQVIDAYNQQKVWAKPFKKDIAPVYRKHGSIESVFKETIRKTELSKQIHFFRGDMAMFVKSRSKNFKCRLAFIDGHHSYDAVCRDIDLIEPFLVAGAWLCFDDAFTVYDGVDRALRKKILRGRRYHNVQRLTRKLFVAQKRD